MEGDVDIDEALLVADRPFVGGQCGLGRRHLGIARDPCGMTRKELARARRAPPEIALALLGRHIEEDRAAQIGDHALGVRGGDRGPLARLHRDHAPALQGEQRFAHQGSADLEDRMSSRSVGS
jgi:hypothetical protein